VSERTASRLWLTTTYAKSHIGAIRFDRRLGSHDRGSSSEGDLQGLLEVRHADVRDRACVERVRQKSEALETAPCETYCRPLPHGVGVRAHTTASQGPRSNAWSRA